MDPIFERRLLKKSVRIDPKFLQKNIGQPLTKQLKMNVEGRCTGEGFIERDSCTITNYSLGRINYVRGGVDYLVDFQADVCFPHSGQKFEGTISNRSRIGIHVELGPMKILIPRDIHIGNVEFDELKIGDMVTFEVVGSQFSQMDTEIIVIAKLLSRVEQVVPVTEEREEEVAKEVVVEETNGEKKIVVAPEVVAATGKRKLKQKKTNESKDEQA